MVILDPRVLAGHSPLTADYQVDGYGPGTELAYIRIPRTVVGEAFRRQVKYNVARRVGYTDSTKMFRVLFQDFFMNADRAEDRRYARLTGYFRSDLTVAGFGTADDFDIFYDELMEEGRIPRVKRDVYIREYQQSVRYWDGVGWVDKPIANKWYLKALKHAGLSPPKGYPIPETK